MPYHGLCEEQIDALILEARLRANPAVMARKAEYERKVRNAMAFAKTKKKETLISILKFDHPAYLVDLLRQRSDWDIQERFARTFYRSFE